MFTLLSKIYGYLYGSKSDPEVEIDIDTDSFLAVLEESTNESNTDMVLACTDTDGTLRAKTCQERIGTVTEIRTNYGLIDNKYYFDIRDIPPQMKVNQRVHYLAYRYQENLEWRVRKIYSILDECWDTGVYSDDTIKADGKEVKDKDSMKKRIIGKVLRRDGREAIITPGNIRCNLDDVSSEFTPLEGDWVALDAMVEVQEDSCDLSGEVLHIEKISPLRSRIVTSTVSQWNPSGEGRIDNVVFFRESCEPGYVPCVGDKVVVDAIESEQGSVNWRALTVVPLITNKKTGIYAVDSDKRISQELDMLLQDKNGITITKDMNFGTVDFGGKKEIIAEIKNNGAYKQLLLRGKFHSRRSQSQFTLVNPQNEEHILLHPGQTVQFHFNCKGRFIGSSSELFVFTFKGFKIGRNLLVEVQEPAMKSLIPPKNDKRYCNSVYRHGKKPSNNAILISGQKTVKAPAFIPVRIGIFHVPDRIWDAVLGQHKEERRFEDIEMDIHNVAPCLLSDLNVSNYADRFHMLLYLEEIQVSLAMQKYNLERVCFKITGPGGEFLSLEVPGLAEKRPSLLVGDRVIASDPYKDTKGMSVDYEGFIHKIFSSEVWIKFNSSFHSSYSGTEYNVSFNFSRTPFRRYHTAINLALTHLGPQMLFPTLIKLKPPQLHIEEQVLAETVSVSCAGTENLEVEPCADSKEINELHSEASVGDNCLNIPFNQSASNLSKTPPRIPVVERLFGSKTSPSGFLNGRNMSDSESSSIFVSEHIPKDTNKCLQEEVVLPDFQRRKLKWINSRLNKYQKDAVLNILNGEARPLPYVIFGPPGTGKTMTLVEAILQILTLVPESRIMVATPSNSSADLIAERLLDSGMLIPGDLVRLVGYHCIEEGTLPERLVPYCTTGDIRLDRGDRDSIPTLGEPLKISSTAKTLGRHRITVGTCSALGIMYTMGFPRGHFTHVLVDEAGQATEPEIMVPLSFIHVSSGQVVLAGDPMQLGPVVTSPFASQMGLSESFLVRLLHCGPYQKDIHGFPNTGGYNPRLVTKLSINYRSVPEILAVPNRLFYDSYLQPQISQTVGAEADILASIANELPYRSKEDGGPPALVFHGVKGKNYQDEDSPSWFNPEEIVQVLYYINILYNVGLSPEDVGVITPYQKQVRKIRIILEEFDVLIPKVGSVEEFQGQERKVIILSAVRSSPQFLKSDLQHMLGFVASPKRLNVALTRARALLIILGNPHLLARDPYWRSVLDYCVAQGGYTGCDLPTDWNSLSLDEKEEEEEEEVGIAIEVKSDV